VVEFDSEELDKLRGGTGGIWRAPPTLEGNTRTPVPRFTTLSEDEKEKLRDFFHSFATVAFDVLRPGGHIFLATTQLFMHEPSIPFQEVGFERRDVMVRPITTLRGGDRPQSNEEKHSMVSTMPRARWEPWLLFRKPFNGTVNDCLENWQTGGLRRQSQETPFTDLLPEGKTNKRQNEIIRQAYPSGEYEHDEDSSKIHPNTKPQHLMRALCHAALPTQEGIILDPFMGSGSTIAAAEALGYNSIGIEIDEVYYTLAQRAIPKLARIETPIDSIGDIASLTGQMSIGDF